jgi:hypothetical protein
MDHQPDDRSWQGITVNLWLLISLLLSLLVLPLLETLYAGRALLLVGITSTFIVGTMATRTRLRLIALALLVVALPITWSTLFVDSRLLFVLHCLLGSVFFWLIGGAIVFVVIKSRSVSLNSVYGAICAYLLFGLAWALSYWAVYSVSPMTFSFPEDRAVEHGEELTRVADFSRFIYYSFVTMTTLGYGDVTPLHRITRTLSWLQTVTGQFYVAVVIAWLVSALPRTGNETT